MDTKNPFSAPGSASKTGSVLSVSQGGLSSDQAEKQLNQDGPNAMPDLSPLIRSEML